MRKYEVLLAIKTHKLDEKSLQLADLQKEHKELDALLDKQYQINDEMLFYIDSVHMQTQHLKRKIQLIDNKIDRIRMDMQELICEKQKIEKALEKHSERIKRKNIQKEVVNMDNIANINYLINNILK